VPRTSLAAATAELAGRDQVLAGLVTRAGPVRLRRANPDGAFGALARAIVYQQLAGSAAAAIHGRFRALVEGPLTPEAVLALPEERLRAAGLSAAKTAAILDLAAKAADGTLPLARIRRLPDDEVVRRLTVVRGIGRWTAEMFLLFELRRPDVWPVDDYGVRSGYARAWGLPAPPPPKVLAGLGDRFRPHRSVAAWYCWRAVELLPRPAPEVL
jgi:DNA-3-methyladenine glycosylase II